MPPLKRPTIKRFVLKRNKLKSPIKLKKSTIKSKVTTKRPTFKEQIESISGRTKHEIFGYKKPRRRFIDKTIKVNENRVRYNERRKYLTGEYTEVHTHLCNPKLPTESTPSPHDFLGWVEDYITTSGKKNKAVVSSVHFENGKELGRVHVLFRKDALNNQIRKLIYDSYVESAKKNKRQIIPFEKFNADLFFFQESRKARTYLNNMIEKDFDFEKRLKFSKTKDLREVFKDIENKWGIKIRPFSHPGHAFDYKRGTFY